VGQPVRVDTDLREWALMDRWSGTVWEDLPSVFPGEFERFMEQPTDLPFAPESLGELAERMAAAIHRLEVAHMHGEIVVVSHSAPIRAAILGLTGTPLSEFWDDRPAHGSVTTLRPGAAWTVDTVWAPDTDLLG
jgi:broad specificity phosphatase PhoE